MLYTDSFVRANPVVIERNLEKSEIWCQHCHLPFSTLTTYGRKLFACCLKLSRRASGPHQIQNLYEADELPYRTSWWSPLSYVAQGIQAVHHDADLFRLRMPFRRLQIVLNY
jgi:hypothetical protein